MKALHVIHYPVFGGPHNEVLRAAEQLAAQGWASVTLLPDEPGSGAERLRAAGLEVVQIPLHRPRAKRDPRLHLALAFGFLPEILHIRRLIRELGIDVVRVFGLLNPHAAIAARLEDKPVLWQVIDTRPPPSVRQAATALALRLADTLLFAGQAAADLHDGAHGFRQPWFTYFPPVDTEVFRPSLERRHRTRRDLGISQHARVVGTVSNLSPQKGVEYLIRAAGLISAEVRDVWLLVVGARYASHRNFLARLDAEIASSQLPRERVIFTDAVSDPEHYYVAMDVKLATSPPRSEGAATTILEALSCGVPVVATDVGAAAEIIDPDRTGLLVPPMDPQAIAAAAVQLLRNEDRRQAMSDLARRAAVERFDVKAYVGVVANGLHQALAHHAGQTGLDSIGPMRTPAGHNSTASVSGVRPGDRGPKQ